MKNLKFLSLLVLITLCGCKSTPVYVYVPTQPEKVKEVTVSPYLRANQTNKQ